MEKACHSQPMCRLPEKHCFLAALRFSSGTNAANHFLGKAAASAKPVRTAD
jgi:hypothetical protein